jgi:hypothetical protein
VNSKDTNGADRESSRRSDFILMICTTFIGVLLITLLGMGKGIASTVSALVIGLAVSATWKQRRYAWYQVTVVLVIALHCALVLLAPWPNAVMTGMYYALYFFSAVDFLIVYGLIKLVESIMGGKGNPGTES